jgi:L-asparaginase
VSRAARLAAALLATLVVLGTAATLEAATRIRLIATGGTIANAEGGRLTPADLVRALPPRALAGLSIEPEEFANTTSASLSIADWVRLSRRIAALFDQDRGLSGVVVTSGTDTLEELALFLHVTVNGLRPIVVTGAMRRPGTEGADGARNLLDALTVAASPRSRGRGTLVVMHGQVHAAIDARKQHATRVDAFDVRSGASLGVVRGQTVRYDGAARPRPRPGLLAVPAGSDVPRVDVLLTYQGATGDLAEAAVAAGARGLVIASAGAGALTPSQADAVTRLAARGIPVVLSTRIGAGQIARVERAPRALIPAGRVPPYEARVLLMLALAHGFDVERIEALFEEASRGIVD